MGYVTVVFVGALPPPVGGQSHINSQVIESLRSLCNLIEINLSPGGLERSFIYHVRRGARVCMGIASVALNAWRSRRHLYVSADSGLGLLYNLAIVAIARLTGYRLFLHYHSFTFIDQRSRLMALLVQIAGAQATHIFLCERMLELFRTHYRFQGGSIICSNARFVPIRTIPIKPHDHRPLRVGLLSHLGAEKGLYEFLELLRTQKLPLVGILAGPPVTEADAEAIKAAQREMGPRLDFRGEIYGDAKQCFYEDIDAFIFPTRFRVEAQPVVVFESLSYGVPIIAYGRGCVASEIDVGLIIPPGSDFVLHAVAQLEEWVAFPERFAAARKAAERLSHRVHEQAETGFAALLATLTGRSE
jgi:glycosyltransferase involved in cell wall biosynthesis